jgi:hypothetical protein
MSNGKQHRQQPDARPSKFSAAADRVLESSLLKKLTFESAPEASAEDRRFDRTNVYARVQVTEIDGSGIEGRSWTASVLDASRGGLGLFSPYESAQGEMLLITFAPRTPDAAADTKLMRVCHCRRGGETGFVIGLRFEGRGEQAA